MPAAPALAVAAWFLLSASTILFPLAIWLAVRWGLLGQVVELEARTGPAHSTELRAGAGRWLHVASLVGVGTVLAFAAGPILGALLILATDAPLPLLNVVAALVYALTLPFVATTSYVYFDARTRFELQARDPDKLPAEIELHG